MDGKIGWLCLATGVLIWDILADESLSRAFWKGLDNPRTKPFILGGLIITNGHLLRVLPEKVDPFFLLAKTLAKARVNYRP